MSSFEARGGLMGKGQKLCQSSQLLFIMRKYNLGEGRQEKGGCGYYVIFCEREGNWLCIQIYQSIMEQEVKSNSNPSHKYAELASMLVLFLHSPSPDLEYRLSQFPPNLYLQLIMNPSQPREVRQACCACFKAQILNRGIFAQHADSVLQHFETIHFSADSRTLEDISGSFEILTEKLFEMYLDDEKKLNAFASIMNRINGNMDISSAPNNLRGIRMAVLLVRAMDASTLNNEVCVGELICFFKQLYYVKNVTSDPKAISGKGLDLLRQAMAERESEGPFAALLDLQIEAIQLVKEIIQKVEIQETEQGDCVPAAYIRNSDEIDNLFQAILSVFHPADGKIYCQNRKVNQLKAIFMGIYLQQFPYHVSEPFLILCFTTLAKCNPQMIYDDVDVLLSGVLQLLQRSTNHSAYASFYYSNTQILILKLFELSAVREAEMRAAEQDPEHFVQIGDDYCKNQQSDSVKVRAGSLIYNLCLTIDGNLTFVTNMAMIPLYALELQLTQQLALPGIQARQLSVQSAKGLPVLLQLWSGSGEALTDVSLLVLSCLSDLIIKRNEFSFSIKEHLNFMTKFFQQRDHILTLLPAHIIARYIQLFSFYSCPNCLDPFLPLYSIRPLFAEAVMKALETVIQFHDKKNQDMRNYVSRLSTKILLLSSKLTPLLQQTIISRPQLILCVKQKLIQKLVNWLLEFYAAGNVFGCNKISNLLCKVIEQYPKFMVQTEDFNFDLQALNAYLIPLYRSLQKQGDHSAQECLVDVAVQHLECLGVRLSEQLLIRFVDMGIAVVKHNQYVLNKCLQLFSLTLSIPGMHRNRERLEYAKLRKMQIETGHHLFPIACKWLQFVQNRDSDQWQLLFLIQILLVTLQGENPLVSALNMSKLAQIYTTSTCQIVKLKVYQVWMLLVQAIRDERCQASQCLQRFPLPSRIPPYQRSNFMIYLMGTITAYSNLQHKVIMLRSLLKMFHPTQKQQKYISNYEQSLHCRSTYAEAQISAFQTVQSVLHPLNALGADAYAEFRNMCQRIPDWHQLRQNLNAQEEEMVREVLGREMVGAKPRRILHIKR